MAEIGGPRHKIELVTKSSSCKIYALIMILPDPDGVETELQLEVEEVESDMVVDGLPYPLTNGISNTGRRSIFKVSDYSNSACAAKIETNSAAAFQIPYNIKLNLTVDGESDYTLSQSTIECHSSSTKCQSLVGYDIASTNLKNFDDDMDSLWGPAEASCVFLVSFVFPPFYTRIINQLRACFSYKHIAVKLIHNIKLLFNNIGYDDYNNNIKRCLQSFRCFYNLQHIHDHSNGFDSVNSVHSGSSRMVYHL